MELINATKMQAAYTLGMEPSGRESVVVAIKGTFKIPQNGSEPQLVEEQVPLVMADEFTGEPGFSATLYESDFAPVKPRCDVLLNGSAYAPGGGRPATLVRVTLRLATVNKSFDVVGDRRLGKSFFFFVRPVKPESFTTKPITYDRAYGGVDTSKKKPDKKKTYLKNPVGVGYYPLTKRGELEGTPLANTQEPGRPAKSRRGRYRPMAYGPIGRNFASRAPLAGTYDKQWLDDVFPFLPADFDTRYYQAAPPDQQIDYPMGGEEVELINLTPEGRARFRLPRMEVPVEFTNASYERTTVEAVLDTIFIEPDQERFLLVWRASITLKKNIFEIPHAVVGRMPKGWYRARDLGKTYYPSLQALVSVQGGEAEAE